MREYRVPIIVGAMIVLLIVAMLVKDIQVVHATNDASKQHVILSKEVRDEIQRVSNTSLRETLRVYTALVCILRSDPEKKLGQVIDSCEGKVDEQVPMPSNTVPPQPPGSSNTTPAPTVSAEPAPEPEPEPNPEPEPQPSPSPQPPPPEPSPTTTIICLPVVGCV